jgi:outer membrane lipoprotein SlyB
MTMNKLGMALAAAALLALTGCGTMGGPSNTSTSTRNDPGTAASGSAYSGYGVVQSIELVHQDASTGIGGSGIGIGAIAGAVVGGVLGNQVGGGTGKTVATVAGAAGGAYVGNEIEKGQRTQTPDSYNISVRMNSGSYQTVNQASSADLRVGDRVRINNGTVQRY